MERRAARSLRVILSSRLLLAVRVRGEGPAFRIRSPPLAERPLPVHHPGARPRLAAAALPRVLGGPAAAGQLALDGRAADVRGLADGVAPVVEAVGHARAGAAGAAHQAD